MRLTFVVSKSFTNGTINAAIMVVSWEIHIFCRIDRKWTADDKLQIN